MVRIAAPLLELTALIAAAWLAAGTFEPLFEEALWWAPAADGVDDAAVPHPRARLDHVTLARALAVADRPRPKRPARLVLRGTLVAADAAWSSALVEDAAGGHVCVLGDPLGDGVLASVAPGRIAVRTPDGLVEVALGGSRDGLPLAPALRDPQRLLTGARALPVVERGQLSGLQLVEVQPDSVYARSGLQPGDVVRRVAGERVSDLERLIARAPALLASGPVELEVERGGLIRRLELDLRD